MLRELRPLLPLEPSYPRRLGPEAPVEPETCPPEEGHDSGHHVEGLSRGLREEQFVSRTRNRSLAALSEGERCLAGRQISAK